MQQYEYPKLKNKEFDALQALDYSYHSENLDTFAEQCQKYMGALLSAVKRIAARSDAEQANPTSHPLSEEEVASCMQEQNEQDRRDYYMVDGKQKILQDALNKMCSWSKNDTFKHEKPVLATLSNGINIVAEAEYPVFSDPMKPTHYNDTAITPFQVIDDWNLDFYLGNVVKYVCRREKKGNELADLRKAATYLAEKIKQLERAE